MLDVWGDAGTGASLLDTPATHEAIIRMSRASGVPKPLPDAFGLAFRLPGVHGPQRPQDILLTTSIDAPVLHHLPMPAPGGPWAQTYSSLLGYRVGSRTGLVGAVPRADMRAFDLVFARLRGRWGRALATLRLGEPLSPDRTEGLDLDVWNCGGGVAPTGPIQGLRRPVYRGSRRGRAEAAAAARR